MRAIRVLAAVVTLGSTAGRAAAQDDIVLSFRDSLVIRQVAYRAPCPQPAPRAWSLVDSTIGRSWKCSLVEAAARAITQFQGLRPQTAGASDPWNPLCVRLVAARNTGSTGLPGDWLVMFDLQVNMPAWVLLDRQTGSVARVAIGHGQMPSGTPRCLP